MKTEPTFFFSFLQKYNYLDALRNPTNREITMIIGALDVSGARTNKYLFLAIVIGVDQNIKALYNKMGQPKVHMTSLRIQRQNKIIKNLKFDKLNRIAFCVTLNRKMIIDTVKARRLPKYSRVPIGSLYAMFEEKLFKYLRHDLEKFTLGYGLSATQLQVECDSDAEVFAKTWGLKRVLTPKATHAITDAVAFCNRRKIKLSDVIELDYTQQIQKEMVRKFRK